MIGRIPQSLCIHLERSVFSYDVVYKVPVYVQFPEELDLSNYCINDVNKDLNFEEKVSSSFSKRTFSLKSLVVHLGGSAEGKISISFFFNLCLFYFFF
jgi:ubiquitin C-terminal hydrolase